MVSACELCDGSGVLTILSSASQEEVEAPWATRWSDVQFPDYCHGCEAGRAWFEAGLNA